MYCNLTVHLQTILIADTRLLGQDQTILSYFFFVFIVKYRIVAMQPSSLTRHKCNRNFSWGSKNFLRKLFVTISTSWLLTNFDYTFVREDFLSKKIVLKNYLYCVVLLQYLQLLQMPKIFILYLLQSDNTIAIFICEGLTLRALFSRRLKLFEFFFLDFFAATASPYKVLHNGNKKSPTKND